MEMINVFKSLLSPDMKIVTCKELASKYKIKMSYKDMSSETELLKTCIPGAEKEVCQKAINNAISTMFINSGDLIEAKKWLDGEFWKINNDIEKMLNLTGELRKLLLDAKQEWQFKTFKECKNVGEEIDYTVKYLMKHGVTIIK